MTEPGQTDEYTLADHVNAIIEHCGNGVIDYCIYDTGEIVPEIIKKYNLEGQDLVIPERGNIKDIKFIQRDLATVSGGYIRHDPNLVAQAVIGLICDDLQYQDKQNDPQYLMLNNKLKEDKRISKIKKQMQKESRKPKKEKKRKGGSKFVSKYGDRMEAIIDSNDLEKEKLKKLKREAKKNSKRKVTSERKKSESRKRTISDD